MNEIKNTSRDMLDPAEQRAYLAESKAAGSPDSFIERQERDGQRQLVNSGRLPSEILYSTQAEFEALGFTFGEPDASDPMFRPATLPPGWKHEGSDHAMWSYIADEHGRRRVSIFYKAAFYDRRAHMTLNGLHAYVWDVVDSGGEYVLDDQWATRETVLATLRAEQGRYEKEAADFRGYATGKGRRDEEDRADCARLAGEREAAAAEWRVRADEFEASHA